MNNIHLSVIKFSKSAGKKSKKSQGGMTIPPVIIKFPKRITCGDAGMLPVISPPIIKQVAPPSIPNVMLLMLVLCLRLVLGFA